MPLTVITLKKVPNSLRGDLTKWMQEIATGVYVGNFNVKIRNHLWKRVVESSGTGEVTMSYAYQNEIGYQFETLNAQRRVVEYDGIPLVALPKIEQVEENKEYKSGYSNAAKFRKAKKYTAKSNKIEVKANYVVVDIETTGLDYQKDNIIEIGAVKVEAGEISYFQKFIRIDRNIPKEITKLTGINEKILENEGVSIKEAMTGFIDFIQDFCIVGYRVDFDLRFLNKSLNDLNENSLKNKVYDLNNFVKREKMNLKDFKLETVLQAYEINEEVPHRALEDAKLIYLLSIKVNKFLKKVNAE